VKRKLIIHERLDEMPEHYNDEFYDRLDDTLHILGATLQSFEEMKESIAGQTHKSGDDPASERNILKSFLNTICLAEAIPLLNNLIAKISSSLLEELKVYAEIDKMVQSDHEVLEGCKKTL
jgi:hypothetical protein